MDDSIYLQRLKERLRIKPCSKLVLSFAEEMKKKDMLDDAISVLVDCIKRNPESEAMHMTLGRWYLASDMLPEAKREFLDVLDKSPGHYFARKGLAGIYRRLEDIDNAAIEYRKVLVSDPFDREALYFLDSIGYPIQSESVATGALAVESEKMICSLNVFLEAVKKRFSEMPVSVQRPDSGIIISRLNDFLNSIKSRYPGEGVVDRLNSFLKGIRNTFGVKEKLWQD